VRPTEEQSRALLAKHSVYVTEICDQCGKILGNVRFTRYGDAGEWCSRLCRDGASIAETYQASRKGGRPRKYQTNRERETAKRRQNAIWAQNHRECRRVGKNPRK
jgi:hypothetical protein